MYDIPYTVCGTTLAIEQQIIPNKFIELLIENRK